MKKSAKSKLLTLIFLTTIYVNSYAQFYKSNVEGLVIKETDCRDNSFPKTLFGTLVNRNTRESRGVLNLKIYDKDSDIVYQRNVGYFVGPQTGTNVQFQIDVGKCSAPYKYQISITECKVARIYDENCMDN